TEFIAGLLNRPNVDLEQDDFDAPTAVLPGSYDAIFCVGLLYHLHWPARFLKVACGSAPLLWLWTVYCAEDDGAIGGRRGTPYRGRMYAEPVAHPLSAVRDESF